MFNKRDSFSVLESADRFTISFPGKVRRVFIFTAIAELCNHTKNQEFGLKFYGGLVPNHSSSFNIHRAIGVLLGYTREQSFNHNLSLPPPNLIQLSLLLPKLLFHD